MAIDAGTSARTIFVRYRVVGDTNGLRTGMIAKSSRDQRCRPGRTRCRSVAGALPVHCRPTDRPLAPNADTPNCIPAVEVVKPHEQGSHFFCHAPAVRRTEQGAVAGGAVILAGIAGLVVFDLGRRSQSAQVRPIANGGGVGSTGTAL